MWQLDWTKLADILTYDPRQPMIFSSGLFLFLFLGFSLIYALLQKRTTARLLFVSAFSYYFIIRVAVSISFIGNRFCKRLSLGR